MEAINQSQPDVDEGWSNYFGKVNDFAELTITFPWYLSAVTCSMANVELSMKTLNLI